MPWVQRSGTTIAWAQLSDVTDATDGIDFRLKARIQHPLKVVTDRPLKALDNPIENP